MTEIITLSSSDLIELNKFESKIRESRSFNWIAVRDVLRFLRKSKIRKSNLVSNYGYKLVNGGYISKIETQESFDIIEQVLVALLECGDSDSASGLLNILKSKFGKQSVRVQRLEAMIHESKFQLKDALDIYNSILSKYPSDQMSMKRQVAIFKSQGNLTKSIQVLNTYLQIFMCDIEAWLELASLHITFLSYNTALFCLEEVILNAPINYIFYVKYAETLYSIGGSDNYNMAIQYYTHSLELNSPTEIDVLDHPPTYLPAIYGIIMSIYSLSDEGVQIKESQLKLMEWAQNHLVLITTKYSSPDKLTLVKHFIDSTDIFNKE